MPHNPNNYKIIPAPLEPQVIKELEQVAYTNNIPRNRLVRILIKYGLNNLKAALSQGDRRPQ